MSARVAGIKAGIETILAYLKAAFPDHTVDAYEDQRFRGHRFVLSKGSGARLAPLIVATATLSDIRGRLDAGFAVRLHRLLQHGDVIGKLQATPPQDRLVFTRAGVNVQRG